MQRRVSTDWQARFGHPLWLLETFVDPRFFLDTSYRAANWLAVGESRGFRRTRAGYSERARTPKRVFVRPLIGNVRVRLSAPILDPRYHHGAPKRLLTADHMRALPEFFADIPDPRRGQGRRHPLPAALGIAAGAVLCGARGYKAIAAWAADLSQQARARFRCRYRNGRYEVPSRTRFRDLLIRIPPEYLDHALQGWNAQMTGADEGLALDGKTLRNAIDEAGQQTHILGAVGHQSQACYTQNKSPPCP
ncbi:transposase family protein [Halochromatium roseum]|uniref:transposase family protein n=1 Tax=Halochromatium roseum TaxID=391920 RepID=UPI00237B87B5|nr:transposase family protein [Halochromatium roseum]